MANLIKTLDFRGLKRLLLIVLIFSMLSFSPLKVSGFVIAPPFNVDVVPFNAGSNASYHIYGSYSEYDHVKTLKVTFRYDTTFSNETPSPDSVIVNGSPVNSVRFYRNEDGSIYAILNLSKEINNGGNIDILFKKEAGVINPIIPATCYKVRVTLINNLGVELDSIMSNSYRISSSAVKDVVVKVDPPIRATKAEYVIDFTTGIKGKIQANYDAIRIKFPAGTILPTFISKSKVLINGVQASAVYRDESDSYTLRIYSINDISENSNVEVKFLKDFGIINPLQAGIKKISVATDEEPDWVESGDYEIFEPQVKDLQINISPSSIGLKAEMNISFETSPVGALTKGNKIYIEFPNDFTLPSNFASQSVLVNGNNAVANIVSNRIEITLGDDIPSQTKVEIKILKDAGILNPLTPGSYSINVFTDADGFKTSYSLEVTPSTISGVKLEAQYSGTGVNNSFKISFTTGPVYTLAKNVDSIIIKFDANFVLPDSPGQNLIKVNGETAITVARDVYSIYVTTPIDIPPSSLVEVVIPESFGIKNPSVPGEYGIKVSTSKEKEEVESNKFLVTPLPVVQFVVSPSQPDGMNGFYKTKPEITLSTPDGEKVFYKINDGSFVEYKGPFKLDEGDSVVYAYAMDKGGNKGDIIKKEFLVDNTPPTVTFDNANNFNLFFKDNNGKLSGRVSEPCSLSIASLNEKVNLDLKDSLAFSVDLKVADNAGIFVFARDLAGNSVSYVFNAHIDDQPPKISIINDNVKYNKDSNIYILETRNDIFEIKLKADENVKVFINSNEVKSDGQIFSYTASLSEGDNQFNIRAVDFVGNETLLNLVIKKVAYMTIKLQIGNKVAQVGNTNVDLQTPPIVENGITLVPLRFIAEAFGAEVKWFEPLKVISISYQLHSIELQLNSLIGILDNNQIKLEVAPKAINGVTLVPVRFISEAFGAKVDWDPQTKTIIITYKP